MVSGSKSKEKCEDIHASRFNQLAWFSTSSVESPDFPVALQNSRREDSPILMKQYLWKSTCTENNVFASEATILFLWLGYPGSITQWTFMGVHRYCYLNGMFNFERPKDFSAFS